MFADIVNEGDFALLIFTFFPTALLVWTKGKYNTLRVYIVLIWQYLFLQQDTGSDRHIGPCVKGKRPNRQADSWSVSCFYLVYFLGFTAVSLVDPVLFGRASVVHFSVSSVKMITFKVTVVFL